MLGSFLRPDHGRRPRPKGSSTLAAGQPPIATRASRRSPPRRALRDGGHRLPAPPPAPCQAGGPLAVRVKFPSVSSSPGFVQPAL